MSGEHFPVGTLPHEPIRFLPAEVMSAVEANVVYACTDVALMDPTTDRLFLGTRQTEPQLGPWLVGGRDLYGESIHTTAQAQVEKDLHMHLAEERFDFIGAYSTPFPIASPGRENHGRHTFNAVMLAKLRPEEVESLNETVTAGNTSKEYSSGHWYTLSEIAEPKSDFPFAIKQLVRDIHDKELLANARHEEALKENRRRDMITQIASKEAIDSERRVGELVHMFGLTQEQAESINMESGPHSFYAIGWANLANSQYKQGAEKLKAELDEMLADPNLGDVQLSRNLKALGVSRPEVFADNGPALRAVLNGGALAIGYDIAQEGALFEKTSPVQIIGRAGPHPTSGEM